MCDSDVWYLPAGPWGKAFNRSSESFEKIFPTRCKLCAAWWQTFLLYIAFSQLFQLLPQIFMYNHPFLFTCFFVCSITRRMEESVCWRTDCRIFTAREFYLTGSCSDFNTSSCSYCYFLWGCKNREPICIECKAFRVFTQRRVEQMMQFSPDNCKGCSVPVNTGLLRNNLKTY